MYEVFRHGAPSCVKIALCSGVKEKIISAIVTKRQIEPFRTRPWIISISKHIAPFFETMTMTMQAKGQNVKRPFTM